MKFRKQNQYTSAVSWLYGCWKSTISCAKAFFTLPKSQDFTESRKLCPRNSTKMKENGSNEDKSWLTWNFTESHGRILNLMTLSFVKLAFRLIE